MAKTTLGKLKPLHIVIIIAVVIVGIYLLTVGKVSPEEQAGIGMLCYSKSTSGSYTQIPCTPKASVLSTQAIIDETGGAQLATDVEAIAFTYTMVSSSNIPFMASVTSVTCTESAMTAPLCETPASALTPAGSQTAAAGTNIITTWTSGIMDVQTGGASDLPDGDYILTVSMFGEADLAQGGTVDYSTSDSLAFTKTAQTLSFTVGVTI